MSFDRTHSSASNSLSNFNPNVILPDSGLWWIEDGDNTGVYEFYIPPYQIITEKHQVSEDSESMSDRDAKDSESVSDQIS
jgi:hypothetical protein